MFSCELTLLGFLILIIFSYPCIIDFVIEKKLKELGNNKSIINLINKTLKNNNADTLIKDYVDNCSSMNFSYAISQHLKQKINFDDTIKAINLIIKDLSMNNKVLNYFRNELINSGNSILNKHLDKYTKPHYTKYIQQKRIMENESRNNEDKRIRKLIKDAED